MFQRIGWFFILTITLWMVGCTSTRPTQESQAEDGLNQAVAGRWHGELLVLDLTLDIVVTFEEVNGQIQGWIDIPKQGVSQKELSDIQLSQDLVRFEMESNLPVAVFAGKWQEDGTLAGEYQQMGYKGSFALARAEAPVETPAAKEPLPYLEEEVHIENGDIRLAGTLTLPETAGPHPVVILISGSGLQDRNSAHPSLPGYEPFRWLADHLTRQGIAVLRYDDRGVGKSSGGEQGVDTTLDYSYDAEAMFNFLVSRSEINPDQVGLLGHSEGSHIAALVASRRPEVAFVISMAGMAVDGDALITLQVEQVDRADGLSEAEIAERAASNRKEIDLILAQDWDGLRAFLTEVNWEYYLSLPPEQRVPDDQLDEAVEQMIDQNMKNMQGWFYYFLTSDPTEEWEHVKVPVLALFGGKDTQVDATQNQTPLALALARAGNQDVTMVVLPTANHLFQEATDGGSQEYGQLTMEFVPGFLDTVSSWLLARVTLP